jgi:hypothetical protein
MRAVDQVKAMDVAGLLALAADLSAAGREALDLRLASLSGISPDAAANLSDHFDIKKRQGDHLVFAGRFFSELAAVRAETPRETRHVPDSD